MSGGGSLVGRRLARRPAARGWSFLPLPPGRP